MKIENIKFKAKRLDNGEWVEGSLTYSQGIAYIHRKESDEDDRCYLTPYKVIPETVCQFTGLTDCKGKEIWEHNLLQSQETKGIYEVVWHENGGFVIKDSVGGGCVPTFVGTALRLFKLKVVGNKYDKEGKV